MYQTLIYCLIPNNTIPRNIIKKICTRIFIEEDNIKVKSLLQWIASKFVFQSNIFCKIDCVFTILILRYLP